MGGDHGGQRKAPAHKQVGKGLASQLPESVAAVWQQNSLMDPEEGAGKIDLAQVQRLIDQNLSVFQSQMFSGESIKQHLRNHVKDLRH